jgi:hypothetical protein
MTFTACVSAGSPWPNGKPCERGSVILIGAEDASEYVVVPRLKTHGADLSRVFALDGYRPPSIVEGGAPLTPFALAALSPLEEVLHDNPDTRLIVIDPIGSFLGGDCDAFRDNEVRSKLAPLAALTFSNWLTIDVEDTGSGQTCQSDFPGTISTRNVTIRDVRPLRQFDRDALTFRDGKKRRVRVFAISRGRV